MEILKVDKNGTSSMNKVASHEQLMGDPPAIDAEIDVKPVLARYENFFQILVKKKFPVDGSCKQNSTIDWCVCYALSGNDYILEIQNFVNYTVLHASLLLTISFPAYIDPPEFESLYLKQHFMFFCGASIVSHITSVLVCTIYFTNLNRAYRASDAMTTRIDDLMMKLGIFFDYLGIICLLICFYFVGANYSYAASYTHLFYSGVITFGIVVAFAHYGFKLDGDQQHVAEVFKEKYCDEFGYLSKESLYMLHGPSDVSEMLTHCGLYDKYSVKFTELCLTVDQCKKLTSDDIKHDIGITDLSDRLTLLVELGLQN